MACSPRRFQRPGAEIWLQNSSRTEWDPAAGPCANQFTNRFSRQPATTMSRGMLKANLSEVIVICRKAGLNQERAKFVAANEI
jgi:hypothetical protein